MRYAVQSASLCTNCSIPSAVYLKDTMCAAVFLGCRLHEIVFLQQMVCSALRHAVVRQMQPPQHSTASPISLLEHRYEAKG